jgi:DNA-3-methyladenine glycosylase II
MSVIDYVPPLDWTFILRYLGTRATQGVESISGNLYSRTISLHGDSGSFTLQPVDSNPAALQVTIAGPVSIHADHIVARIRTMLDLDTDLAKVHGVLGRDPHLRALLVDSPGVRVPGGWSPFELLVRTIVGQQVTVRAATTIMGRIASRFGIVLETDNGVPASFIFPTPDALVDGDWSGIGMPGKRAATIQNLAKAIRDRQIPFPGEFHAEIDSKLRDEIKTALLGLPGIGPWTVEYFSLRGLRDANAWPESDLVLKREVQKLTGVADVRKSNRVRQWEPYRGYAAMSLWNRASSRPISKNAHSSEV